MVSVEFAKVWAQSAALPLCGHYTKMSDPIAAKAQMRGQLRARLAQIAPADRQAQSALLVERLVQSKPWQSARSVLLYAPLPDEPDLWPVLALALMSGKTAALPAFDPKTDRYVARRVDDPDRQIVLGRFGIREAAEAAAKMSLNQLDLVLVPGVAYDARGGRLGRGRGFYDRLLAEAAGIKCGVAFDEQLVATVPLEPHDIRLNCILTPTRWIET
jgi:5-formyltetrahydrofolate cyclo-ligase